MNCWVFFKKPYLDKNVFENREDLIFHEEYSNKLHHIRGKYWPNNSFYKIRKKTDYIYSTISPFKKTKKNILIQGDSWAEYMLHNKFNYELMEIISKDNNFGLINSGNSSYSPSAMLVQYKILKKDFKINPEYIITIIDQTDIGDELCRYKNNLIFNNNELTHIQREKNTGVTFDYSKYYELSNIVLGDKKINIKATNYYFKKIFLETKYKIYSFLFKKKRSLSSINCKIESVLNYLFFLDIDEEKYFKLRLKEYLNYLANDLGVKKIFVVTFPHLSHLKNHYKYNVSNYVEDIYPNIKNSNKITHLNFQKFIDDGVFPRNNIFQPRDLASHLTEKSTNLFIKLIFDNLSLIKQ